MTTVFHSGEILIQTESGVKERVHKMASKFVRNHIIDQHKEFFENQNYAFIALHDDYGKPWISLVQGPTGFIHSPDQTCLNIQAKAIAQDELSLQVGLGHAVGFLGLEFHSRRRNRLNGNFQKHENAEHMSIKVGHSFGNCPKYIQLRSFDRHSIQQVKTQKSGRSYEHIVAFNEQDINLIENADTLFIASAEQPHADLDASHRGGKPGFVRLKNNNELWFNDYPGNNFFQTFGNLHNYPYCGLMFIDFKSGDILLLSGQSRLEKISNTKNLAEKKTNFIPRRFHFILEKGLRIKRAVEGQWSDVELSPFLDKIDD